MADFYSGQIHAPGELLLAALLATHSTTGCTLILGIADWGERALHTLTIPTTQHGPQRRGGNNTDHRHDSSGDM